jgi:uncharacterized protein (DUF2062 family)
LKKIIEFLRSVYLKLFKIDDSPQKVALGFGLGVFLGIFPGTGPFASLILALLLRFNRAAAVIGCLATNAWISVLAFVLAMQAGALIFGLDWKTMKSTPLKFVLPISAGYVLIGLIFGSISYLATLVIIKSVKRRKNADK